MNVSASIQIEALVSAIISRHIQPDAFAWLQEKANAISTENSVVQLNIAFAAVPEKQEEASLNLLKRNANSLKVGIKVFQSTNGRRTGYAGFGYYFISTIMMNQPTALKSKTFFKGAEVNELVALYSSLIILKDPEAWKLRCAEGIRSNIGTVLEAIMYENPYPHLYLDEPAWNQLVLKAFFTEKDVNRITGLDERANKQLASILVDYAHERWAAQRKVNPLLWRLVAGFINERNFPDITRVYTNGDLRQKKAAVLACYQSDYEPARRLVEENPEFKKAISNKILRWETL